jgi:hypothetical protein
MFKWLNKQAVESDHGFIVQSKSRFIIEYCEGANKVSVDVEDGRTSEGNYFVYIEPNAFQRWDGDPPYVSLPSERQDQMLANFADALEFMDIGLVIEPRPAS